MFLRNRHSLWLRLFMALMAMLLFLLGYQWGNRYQRASEAPPSIQGVLVRPPLELPEIALSDALGRAFDKAALGEDWALLTFGDLTGASGQLAIQRLVDVYNRLADRHDLQAALRLVLVTTRDAPRLARDFTALSPALHVLGGGTEAIAPLRDALGAGSPGSEPLFVLAPGARLVAVLPDAESRAAMAEDVATLYARSDWLLADAQPPETAPKSPEPH